MKNKLKDWWQERDIRTRMLPIHLKKAVSNYLRYGGQRGAALSYYAVFSIFPLTLLFTVTISGLVGSRVAEEQIIQALDLFLPEGEVTQLLASNISRAAEQGASFGFVAIIGLLWSGLGFFSNVSASLDMIFRVPKGRSIWRQRLMALGMTLTLVVLVVTSFVISGLLWLLSVMVPNIPGFWADFAPILLPISLNLMIYVLLFRFVPARPMLWDAIWPAAIVGAVGWELAKAGFTWYLRNLANYQLVYGSIATVIVLLFWAYLLATVFLFSAELCAQLHEWLEKDYTEDTTEITVT